MRELKIRKLQQNPLAKKSVNKGKRIFEMMQVYIIRCLVL